MSALTEQRPPADDAALAAGVAAGDTAAFELLMRLHNRRLYRLARATLGDEAEAEEALQDAYLRAFRAMGQFRGESSLSTWLCRLVLHECLARLRRESRRSGIVQFVSTEADEHVEREFMSHPSCSATPHEHAERAEVRALLERRLDELPEAFRVVFTLRSVEEMDVGEAARCLGIPEATVRSRYFRARAMLRQSLAQDFDVAARDVFSFGGERCDRVVAAVLAAIRLPSAAR